MSNISFHPMNRVNDNPILDLFRGTLSVDHTIRAQSELQLNNLSKLPGFLGDCFGIITSNSTSSNAICKEINMAISVFLKNLINKSWDQSDIELDRGFIRSNFVQIMSSCEYNTKRQFLTCLRVILHHEGANWIELLNHTDAVLVSMDLESLTTSALVCEDLQNKMYTAVLLVSEICRYYKFTKNDLRPELDIVLKQFFPNLLLMGNLLFQDSDNLTEFKSEILKLIFKCYKFVTYFDLPVYLQQKENVIIWGQFHSQILTIKLPQYVLASNFNEHEKNQLQISKVMKWSLSNINRIVVRYINITKTATNTEFRQIYLQEYLPFLLKGLFKMIEQWCGHTRWINLSTLYVMIDILKNCLNFKHLWLQIKDILPNVVEYFLFPVLMLDDHKVLVFENDPYEYIQLIFTVFLDGNNKNCPDFAAIGFIQTLITKRRKSCLDLIINFCYQKLYSLVQVEETVEVAKEKEAVLRIFSSITDNLLNNQKNKYYHSMEDIFINLILPNLNSSFKFLVARTFDLVGHFSDLEFKNPDHLNLLIYEILKNFGLNGHEIETNLVVNLENALCMQSYLHIDEFKESLSFIILPVMSKLLEISNEVDNDTISVVMQECVENFGEQLQPFGTELVYKLVDNFMKILSEQHEQENEDDENDTDKVITGIGVLNTIITVLLSFDNNKTIIKQLTKILIPLVKHILVTENEHFVSEICEIIENLVYLNKQVTLELFEILKLINILINNDIGALYFEEVLPSLKNYLLYYPSKDANELSEQNVKEIDEIYLNIFSILNKKLDYLNDLILNFELIQYFVLMLKSDSVKYFPFIIEKSVPMFKYFGHDQLKNFDSSSLFKISFLNVFIAMTIYDSNLVIFQLKDHFTVFLGQWFTIIPVLTRTYDIKLSILGLISLINNNNLMITMEFSEKLVHLLQKLPLAIKELEKRRKSFNVDDLDELYQLEPNAEIIDITHKSKQEEIDSDDDIINEDHSEYLDFLNKENMKLVEDDVIEDPMEVTPLDHTNLRAILKNFLSLLRVNNGAKYRKLFGGCERELEEFIHG